MEEMALSAPIPPRLEDFGLTAEEFKAVPESKIGPRRALFFLGVYGTAATLVFLATLTISGSIIGAVFFGILLLAAGSVLLVPAITGLVCALETCEQCWMCRRHAQYRAASYYRKAMKAYEVEVQRLQAVQHRHGEAFWRSLDHPRLVAETIRVLESAGHVVNRVAPELDSGIDLLVTRAEEVTAVKCAAGGVVTGRSLGRELAAAARDIGAFETLLVAPGGVDSDLSLYLEEHHGKAIDSAELSRMGQHLPA